jgi:hypothetical protein
MGRMFSSLVILVILSSTLCAIMVHGSKALTTNQLVDIKPPIYIRADGSVDPSTAPIQRNGDIYTLTGDMEPTLLGSTFLVIERSNMTLDGADHTLNCYHNPLASPTTAVGVTGMSNITLTNLTITGFACCISLSDCFNITVTASTLDPWWWIGETQNGYPYAPYGYGGPAIDLANTSDCVIVENYVTRGIVFEPTNASNSNRIFHNNFQFVPQSLIVRSDEVSGNNSWDDGYPSGGNYWNSHTQPDFFSGPRQNETGSDGIVDTPVTVGEGNVDHYPLVVPRKPYAYGPAASFTVSASFSLAREPVEFNASTSTPGWNGTQVMLIKEYRWDFGDGNVTSISPPFSSIYPKISHAYHDPGTFRPTLTVIDNEDLNSSASQSVYVNMQALISLSTSSPSTSVGYKVTISGKLFDKWGENVQDQTIMLSYIFAGLQDWIPITSTSTDSLGNYQAIWIPAATGSFTLKASWAGNSTWWGNTISTAITSLPYGSQYIFTVESDSNVQELSFNATTRKLSFTTTGSNDIQGYARVTIPRNLVASGGNIKAYIDNAPAPCGIASEDDSYVVTLSYAHSTHVVTISLGSSSASFIDTLPGKIAIFGVPIAALVAAAAIYLLRKKRK